MRIFEDIPTSEMILVEGGSFMMGYFKDHLVTLPSFWIGKYPVTQALWKEVMQGENPSYFRGDDRPVESVSWNDIKDSFLPELILQTGKDYRLPSEAEWEYAARGGKMKEDLEFCGSKIIDEVSWYNINSHMETKQVGLKAPNQLGIYDMSGNIWEWCEDDWSGNLEATPKDGSPWRVTYTPDRGSGRVQRGGGWDGNGTGNRVMYRSTYGPRLHGSNIGFRLVLSLQ